MQVVQQRSACIRMQVGVVYKGAPPNSMPGYAPEPELTEGRSGRSARVGTRVCAHENEVLITTTRTDGR